MGHARSVRDFGEAANQRKRAVMKNETAVLIAGGGLSGLTAALLLAKRGVGCIVVERHPRTSIQYKFAGISPRSMEIYREAGIEQDIRKLVTRDQKAGGIARLRNMADPQITWDRMRAWPETLDISPVTAATLDQDLLEPILKEHAESFGADIRFHTELLTLEETENQIRARVRDNSSGREQGIEAEYLLVADGASGTVHDQLGIRRHGLGVLQHWINVIFEADLKRSLDGRQLTSAFITDIDGVFVPRGDGRWLMAVQYSPERGEKEEDFTPEHCLGLIRKGAGRSDVEASVVDVRAWQPAASIADQYRKGRAFLVGDAAHLTPPTGGFGGNTGIHDVHNIAWKLDMVLRAAAGPALLDTYDTERRYVADRTLAQALARLKAWFKNAGKPLPDTEDVIPDENVVFGYVYPSGALIADNESPIGFENPHRPSGHPGARAPNLFVQYEGNKTFLYDLFNGQWVLLAGPDGHRWRTAGTSIDGMGNLPLQSFQIGAELADCSGRWSSAYGVSAGGAVLIRPDNFVAWRSKGTDDDPETALRAAITCLLDLL
jgi:putative polyketide hydroxylase